MERATILVKGDDVDIKVGISGILELRVSQDDTRDLLGGAKAFVDFIERSGWSNVSRDSPALADAFLKSVVRMLEQVLVKVKVCGNCDRFIDGSLAHYENNDSCCQICLLPDSGPDDWERPDWTRDGPFATGCKHWEPKEVSKKEWYR